MKAESNSLIDVLNNIVKGYKDIKLDGLTEPSEVTVAYRSIFGNEYKDINKEIIAEQLSEEIEKEGESEKEGKWKAFYNFLKGRDCLWMDLIGCDSFSDKIKKQIFFATISMNDDVANQRGKFLDAYKKLIKSIPLDLFIQLFFIDRERFLNGLKRKESVDKETIKSLVDSLVKIQSNGFVLSFSLNQDNESLNQDNESKDYPRVLDVRVESFENYDDFETEIKNIDVQKISYPLEVKKLLESFDYKLKPETATLSDLSTLIARFNRSLHSQITFLYFVPIHCPDGSVGLFCYGSKAANLLDSDTIDELKLLSYNLLYPYVSSYKSAWDSKQVIKESIKSAIAAIMSRNMSHNLGSHYLYYTKTQLTSLADELGNKAPDIRGAAKVISYIQGRMDYLATIISNDKYPYGSVNFKSQIWDELTVDDFSRRHYSSSEPVQLSRIVYDEQWLVVQNLLKQIKKLNHTYDSIKLANTSTSEDIISIGDDLKFQMEKITTKIGEMYGKISKGGVNRRTTNFLLTNIILSENYTRPSIIDAKLVDGKQSLQLYASLWNENTHQFELFTGTDNTDVSRGRTMMEEVEVKTQLSRLDLALPGGTMSCHAFFNILENFIRNSAKYSWSKRSWSKRCKQNDLIFTVAMKVDQNNHTIEFTIFDNKCDAYKKREKHKLINSLKSRLSSLVILGNNNTIDKENKGLKEMLFSAVWLRANEFDESLATIFTKIQMASSESKLELIKAYAFEFVSVDQNGMPCSDSGRANLGIRFNIPIFKRSERLRNKKVRIEQLLRLHTDIIDVLPTKNAKNRHMFKRPYEHIFTRLCYSDSSVLDVGQFANMPVLDRTDMEVGMDILRLRYAIQKNLGCIDDYLLTMNGTVEPAINQNAPIDCSHIIRYDTHFSTILTIKQLRKDFYGKFAYVDTISGNNFSKTLEGMFKSGVVEKDGKRLYASWSDMYLSLKIKEAAITHITIIDERLFNSIQWNISLKGKVDRKVDIRKSAYELSMQNIRVLNFDELGEWEPISRKKPSCALPDNPLASVDGFPLLYGNSFLPIGPFAATPNGTHFLSIHLGLIEKILTSNRANSICGEKGENALSEERVMKFMNELIKIFSYPKGHLHICIHSGRGNYSSELAGPLKEYPFISLAALESSFNNSKYLLAQLFYNTIYIGKGEINK